MNEILATEHHTDASATMDGDDQQTELQRYLTFTVDKEIYAFDIQSINEIIEYEQITRIPMAPGCIRGLFNLRGHVLPLIDLASRLGLHSNVPNKRTSIIVLTLQHQEHSITLGVVVDAINQVLQIDKNTIEPRPDFGMAIDARFVEGMAKTNKGFFSLIKTDSVLSVEELSSIIGDFSRHTYSEFCRQAKGIQ